MLVVLVFGGFDFGVVVVFRDVDFGVVVGCGLPPPGIEMEVGKTLVVGG